MGLKDHMQVEGLWIKQLGIYTPIPTFQLSNHSSPYPIQKTWAWTQEKLIQYQADKKVRGVGAHTGDEMNVYKLNAETPSPAPSSHPGPEGQSKASILHALQTKEKLNLPTPQRKELRSEKSTGNP